jgi:hypothetical protein
VTRRLQSSTLLDDSNTLELSAFTLRSIFLDLLNSGVLAPAYLTVIGDNYASARTNRKVQLFSSYQGLV